MRIKLGWEKWLLSAGLAGLLAACGTSTVQPENPGGSSETYLLTVKLQSAETQAEVAQRYGGEVVVWLEGERAVLKMNAEAKSALLSSGVSLQNTTLESNIPLKAPEVQASGWNAWGSGWNAWSGGWNAWSGGWNAWSGGTSTPALPSENNPIWSAIRLRQAHAASTNVGAGVKVAVLDTGVDTSHSMFTGRLAPSSEWKDFVGNDANPQEVNANTTPNAFGHGTAVAGIITQVAPRATILPIRVLSPNGSGTLDSVVQGIYWAADKGAQIINLSLGSTEYATALYDSIAYAHSKGAYVVASAGNAGVEGNSTYPAHMTSWFPGYKLMGISSVKSNFQASSFSNRGYQNYAAAPGEDLFSAYPGNQVVKTIGTSFAAPLFAGTLALVYSDTPVAHRPNLEFFVNAGINKGGPTDTAVNANPGSVSRGVLDAESMLYNIPGFASRTAALSNLGTNRGFESSLTGWSTNGTVSIVTTNMRSGTRAAQISGQGSVGQTISGLSPNTNYLATVWIRNVNSTDAPLIQVNNASSVTALSYRFAALPSSYTQGIYRRHAIAFTTGANTNSVYIHAYSNSGTVLVDDFLLQRMGY